MNPGKELRPEDIENLVKIPCNLWAKSTRDPKHPDEPSWTEIHFRHDSMNKGDIIYITCRYIIETNDTSDWALDALEVCFLLLQEELRWPHEMSHENDAKNNLVYKVDLFRWKIWYAFNKPKPGHRLYRPQGSITRDPYIYFFTAAAMLEQWHYIQYTEIPKYLTFYSTPTRKWAKYMKSGLEVDYQAYTKAEFKGGDSQKDYVKLLNYYRQIGAKYRKDYDRAKLVFSPEPNTSIAEAGKT